MPSLELVLCGSFQGVSAFVVRAISKLRAQDPLAPARTLLLVPTAAAARLVRRRLEDALLARRSAAVLPVIETPSRLVELLAERSEGRLSLVDPLLREALVEKAFGTAVAGDTRPPFAVRPSLASRVLQFLDDLRARSSPDHGLESFFARALEEMEAPDDEGAMKLASQTRFLQASLEDYHRSLGSLGRYDAAGIREALRRERFPFPRVFVLGPDAAEPYDLDFLAEAPGIEELFLVVAESRASLPQSLTRRFPTERAFGGGNENAPPRVLAPSESEDVVFLARDREECLRDVARLLKLLEEDGRLPPLHRVAVLVPHPLPYLYLVKKIFGETGVPFQLQDSFPLATEPYMAAVDVVLDLVATRGRRDAALALLRSPFFDFPGVGGREVAAFDALTLLYHEPGGGGRWESLLARLNRPPLQPTLPGIGGAEPAERAVPAVAAIVAASEALAPLAEKSPLTEKIAGLRRYLETQGRPLDEIFPATEERSRASRARAAFESILERLRDAARQVGDPACDFPSFHDRLRRAVEAHTFALPGPQQGVQIVDARSAPFGSFDLVVLVGLNEGEWPSRSERNIFYPQWLLRDFGWPSDRELLASERERFLRLLALAEKHVALFRHQLEDEIPTVASPFLDEARVFIAERALERASIAGPLQDVVVSRAEALRRGLVASGAGPKRRAAAGDVEGPLEVPEPISPTAFELYLRCPFKYFSRYLLGLEEEEEVEETLTALERGRILHELLEEGLAEWDRGGGGAPRALEPSTYEEALELFRRIALRKIPPEHRSLEIAWLFGGAGEPGAIPWLLRGEMARGAPRERRVEHAFQSPLRIDEGPRGEKPWYVRIKGRVDRADVDADGYLHVFDYKSGRAPAEAVALQVPLYAMCLAQELGAPVREATYLSFRDRKASPRRDFERAAALLARSYGAIRAGRFAPRPFQDHLCQSCGFVGVCRKEIAEVER